MKLNRIIFFIGIIFIIIQSLTSCVYAESNKEFKFEKTTYQLRGEHSDEAIDLVLPDGYTIKDVEITSENENIVKIIEVNDWDWNIYHRYFMESLSVGETRLKATIKSTNYVAYCNVKVEEPVIINVSKNNNNLGATLDIDSCCNLYWSDEARQACEISVMPLNSGKEEKWIRLGEESLFGEALNKKYQYEISDNCVVTVRWIAWWNGINYNGESELYRKTIVIDDLESSVSIGAHLKIYANNYNETYSTVDVGNNLKLNAEIVEMSNDTPITWKSYQQNVAIIDSNGMVTALKGGTARIEATAGGMTDVYTVIVRDNNAIDAQQLLETNGAVFGKIPNEISAGNSEQALIYGDRFNITWSSTNDEIATVNKDGLIKGISNGDVRINVNIAYNNKTYKIAQEVRVSGGKTEDKENTDEIKENTNKNTNNKSTTTDNTADNTTAKTILPHTGESTVIMIIEIILFFVISIIMYKKYNNYKDIK